MKIVAVLFLGLHGQPDAGRTALVADPDADFRIGSEGVGQSQLDLVLSGESGGEAGPEDTLRVDGEVVESDSEIGEALDTESRGVGRGDDAAVALAVEGEGGLTKPVGGEGDDFAGVRGGVIADEGTVRMGGAGHQLILEQARRNLGENNGNGRAVEAIAHD